MAETLSYSRRSHLHILRLAELQQPCHDGAEERVAEGRRYKTLRPPLSIAGRDVVPLRSVLCHQASRGPRLKRSTAARH